MLSFSRPRHPAWNEGSRTGDHGRRGLGLGPSQLSAYGRRDGRPEGRRSLQSFQGPFSGLGYAGSGMQFSGGANPRAMSMNVGSLGGQWAEWGSGRAARPFDGGGGYGTLDLYGMQMPQRGHRGAVAGRGADRYVGLGGRMGCGGEECLRHMLLQRAGLQGQQFGFDDYDDEEYFGAYGYADEGHDGCMFDHSCSPGFYSR
jgi:hypothetical protein